MFLNFGYLKEGGKEIDDVGRSVAEFVFYVNPFWPVRDQGSGDTAFMCPGFVLF